MEDKGFLFVRFATAFIVLSTVAIILRFWSRAVQPRRKFWWDDWVTLLAWVFGIIIDVLGIVWTKHGLGLHQNDIIPSNQLLGMKIDFAKSFLFNLGVGTIKLAALLFYIRLFDRNRLFAIAIWITGAIVASWMLAFILTLIFNCQPIHKFWDKDIPGHCINFWRWYIGSGIVDVVLDIIVVALPAPLVWKLKMNTSKKIRVTLAFLFGYLAVVPSLGRFISTLVLGSNIENDYTYRGIANIILSDMEIPFAVISLCVPSFFNLYKHYHDKGFLSTSAPSQDLSEDSNYLKLQTPRSKTDIEFAASGSRERKERVDLLRQAPLTASSDLSDKQNLQ